MPGATGEVGGYGPVVEAITGTIERDLLRGEGIALPLTFVVMFFVFGGFVAAGMPVLGAVVSIGGALLSLFGFSHVLDLEASVVNIVTLLGLGLSIDYGLLTVSRFREELWRAHPETDFPREASPARCHRGAGGGDVARVPSRAVDARSVRRSVHSGWSVFAVPT